MNIIMLEGHLGADPVVRYSDKGLKATEFSVAVNSRHKNALETIWYKVTLWGEAYDQLIFYLKKGSAVVVHGELRPPSTFKGKDGQDRVSLGVTAFHLAFPTTKRSEELVTAKDEGPSSRKIEEDPLEKAKAAFRTQESDFTSGPPLF